MSDRDNVQELLEGRGYSTIREHDFIYDDLASIQSLVGYEDYKEIQERLQQLAKRIELLQGGRNLFCIGCGRLLDLEQMKNNRICVLCLDQ